MPRSQSSTMRTPRAGKAVAMLVATVSALAVSERTWAADVPSRPLIFAGSGTNLGITRILAEEFGKLHPRTKIEVPPSLGSTGGIRAAADGAITVGLISRPLLEHEKTLGLTVVTYARSAIVIGAHPSVADDGITFDDLVGIYKGEKTRWKDGKEILVLVRQPGDSSNEVLERVIPGFKEVYAESQRTKRWRTLFTDQDMNRALTRTPYAIGLADAGMVAAEQLAIKSLMVNGVSPTPENALSGKYPLVKTLAFVFLPNTLPPEAAAFLDFVRSKEGARILRINAYLPGQ